MDCEGQKGIVILNERCIDAVFDYGVYRIKHTIKKKIEERKEDNANPNEAIVKLNATLRTEIESIKDENILVFL